MKGPMLIFNEIDPWSAIPEIVPSSVKWTRLSMDEMDGVAVLMLIAKLNITTALENGLVDMSFESMIRLCKKS